MSSSQVHSQNKAWLREQVNIVLEPMLLQLVQEKPDNQIAYMVKFMEDQYGEQALNGDKEQAAILQKKIDELEAKLASQQASTAEESKGRDDLNSEEDTDEDSEGDYVDALPTPKKNKNGQAVPRASVSAEAFGVWNQKGSFTAKVIQKSADAKKQIYEKLNMAFMFSALDEKEKEIVVSAMEEVKVDVNDVVIKEGDQGDCLYVVGSGTLSCTKIFKGNTDPSFLKSYTPGEAFGELALLYNAPRAATITAIEACTLYKLDRDTFNHIVKDSAQRKRDKYEEFLGKVPILSSMEPYERTKLADAFTEHRFKAGETIIKEGDPGNELFFVQEGQCIATKTMKPGEQPTKVMDYEVGGFFGERALLKNEPRAANIIAQSECLLISMDRHSVKRLLGPLQDVLKRNFDLYEKYAVNN